MVGIAYCRWMLLVVLVAAGVGVGCQGRNGKLGWGAERDEVEVVESHWPSGELRMRKEMVRDSEGVLIEHGKYQTWFPDGTLEYEATYVDGKLHGTEIAYHENGQKRTEAQYEHGDRHGKRLTWDQEGNLRKEEYYVHDKPHGTWKIWKASGELKWEGRFEDGKPLP